MAKKKSVQKESKSQRTASVEELFQDCPECDNEFLVKVQSEKGLQYLCSGCGHEEFRKWSK